MPDRIKDINNIDSLDDNKILILNNQLENIWNNFFQSDQKDELKKIDYTKTDRKNKAEIIFDNWVINNQEKIKDIINLNLDLDQDQNKEKEKIIEDNILNNGLDLNSLEIEIELKNLKNEIIDKNSTNINDNDIPQLKTILTNIENQPDIPEEKTKTIKEYLKEGNFIGAINEAFDFIGDMFGSFMGTKLGLTISEKYDDITNNLKNIDFTTMAKEEIQKQIEKLEIKIDNISDINKKLSITYILSIFKEQFTLKSNPDSNKYELLENNLTVGTVLLLNKKSKTKENIKSKAGRLSLENYNDSLDISYTHSVIVSRKNPTYITHSTMEKFGEKGNGVQEILLKDYLDSYKSVDILALDMPQDNKDKALTYTKEKLDKKTQYDDGVALNELSGGYIGSDNLEKVNCVELIAEGLGEEKIKDISDPNDFLKSSILKPIYMTEYKS